MSEFIGEVKMFAGNFAPRSWAFCEGQLLPISQNSALFSILGTMYGGDGRTTFGLPNMNGRFPVGVGDRGRTTTFDPDLGDTGGSPTTTIQIHNLPAHQHGVDITTTADLSGITLAGDVKVKVADNDGDNVKAKNNAIGFKAIDSTGDTLNVYRKNPVFTNDNILGGVENTIALTNPGTGAVPVQGDTAFTGGSQPIGILPPYQAVNFIICLQGIFPS